MRKISPAKWPRQDENLVLDEYRADAITGDLRTTNDTISLWRINELNELDEAVLALASGLDDFCTINVLAIPEDKFEEYGFALSETKGDTPYERMEDRHCEIIEVNYKSLGLIAQLVAKSIRIDGVHTRTRKTVKKLLLNAYQDGLLNRSKLRDNMSNSLEIESAGVSLHGNV